MAQRAIIIRDQESVIGVGGSGIGIPGQIQCTGVSIGIRPAPCYAPRMLLQEIRGDPTQGSSIGSQVDMTYIPFFDDGNGENRYE
jgi:hypothetical protein